jgi:hypothetical protein
MKKHIRKMFDDLNQKRGAKDYIPPVPVAPTDGKVIDMDVVLDGANQEPPCDPEETEPTE